MQSARPAIFWVAASITAISVFCLPGCKLVANDRASDQKAAASGADAAKTDVAAIWDSKVVPYMNAKAAPLNDILTAIAADPDKAGETFGYKEKLGNAPYVFVARVEGVIVEAETTSRAGWIDIDTNADKKADIRIQTGPAMRGTAIRDSLDFVSFNDFRNQIDYAQFGKAFNQHAFSAVLEKLDRTSLPGKKVTSIGAFPMPQPQTLPLLAPVSLDISP